MRENSHHATNCCGEDVTQADRLGSPPPHLFEYEDTVPRADELGELSDASLVEVRPGEAAVIKVDFGAAVFPVALPCAWTHVWRGNISGCKTVGKMMDPGRKAQHRPVSDWLAACCLTESGDDDLGGARLQSWNKENIKWFLHSRYIVNTAIPLLLLWVLQLIIIIIDMYSLFFWLHHSNLSLFFNCKT